MNHDTALISAYHDGALPPAKRRLIESHLRACPECREVLNDYRELRRGLESLPWQQARPEMLGEIRAQVAAKRMRRRRIAWLGPLAGAAAAMTAAAAAFFAGTLIPSAPPASLPESRPVVAFALPAPGVIQLPPEAVIELNFDTPVDKNAVEESLTFSPAVAAHLEWDDEKLRIVPENSLEPGADYTISVAPGTAQPAPSPYSLHVRTVAPNSGDSPAVALEPAPPAPAMVQSQPSPTATPASPQFAGTPSPFGALSVAGTQGVTTCPVPAAAGLNRLRQERPDLLTKLGCATAVETRAALTEQSFEAGMLVWRGDLSWTYALQAQPRRWTSYSEGAAVSSTFGTQGAAAVPTAVASSGQNARPSSFVTVTVTPDANRELPTEPSATFLRLWRLQPELRMLVGGPVRRERQGDAVVQDFQNGLALVTNWGAVFTLYGDRSWGYLPEVDDNPRYMR